MKIVRKRLFIVVIAAASAVIIILAFFSINSYLQKNNQSAITPDDIQVDSDILTDSEISLIHDTSQKEEKLSYTKGMFSWSPSTTDYKKRDALYQVIINLNIDELYQYFTSIEIDDYDAYSMATVLNAIGVDLYFLEGEAEWAYSPDGEEMISRIERAAAFREYWGEGSVEGIVFDIEPYTTDSWANGNDEKLMENFVSGMKAAYEEAKKHELRVILCIPVWYDKYYEDYLLQLLNYCDEIAVMNYDRANEYNNIIGEIQYAREYGTDISCIFEFQPAGEHSLNDNGTYYNLGIDAANESFENLYVKADYKDLKFVYHYLAPIQELLNIQID